MTYIPQSSVGISDGANLDAFSRLRVSTPTYVFDAQFTYDLQPQIYEDVSTDGGAGVATVTHDATNRMALMTFTGAGSGASAYLQTYEYLRYQPGRSQLCFITFNFLSTAANCTKFAGYSDGVNGIELQQAGTTVQLMLYSATGNGNQTVAQSSWNLDKLNGAGGSANPSGLTLDLTKTQILVIDLQALYVGRVRVGFDIGGQVVYVHQFNHANLIVTPYIQNANRPIRVGMVTTAGSVSTTMNFICASVISEGGSDLPSYEFSQDIGVGAGTSLTADVRVPLISIRPLTTFNGITNRVKFELQAIEAMVTSGANGAYWELLLGYWVNPPTTWTAVATGYSAFEYTTTFTGGLATPVSRTATAGSATTLTDTSAVAWKANNFAGCTVTLTGGTGSGQSRIIQSNTTTVLTVSKIWTTPPDATSTYSITNPTSYPIRVASGYLGGGTTSRQPTTYMARTRAPITLNKLGFVSNQATLTLVGAGIGGAAPTRACMSWHEDR